VAGDKGYSYDRIRRWLRRRGIAAVIPQREDQRKKRRRGRPLKFDKELYRRRNVVERCVGWLKECRAVATRFEKLARHYLGMVKMSMVERYLRLLDSPYKA
jgi:transposase